VNIAFSIRSTTGSKTEALQAIERENKEKKNADPTTSPESDMEE
jgi:phosphate:Na+ symporter